MNLLSLSTDHEWKYCKLGQLVDKVGSGVTPKGGEESYVSSGVPLIRSQNVLWGRLDLSNVAFIDEVQNHKMKSSRVLVDDVLLNITGASIGRACIVPDFVKQANVNQHVCIIRVNSNLDSKYLCGYLLSDYGQKQIDDFQAGGNREGLNFEQIKSFKIPLPPLPEQKRIVSVLETWDKAIELLTKKIEIKKNIKKGLMQELLTGKRRLKGFDGQWEKTNLFDCCDIRDGTHDSPKYVEDGIPLITQKNITGGKLSFKDVKLISSEDAFAINKRSRVGQGDILMSMIGSIGDVVLVENMEVPFCIKNVALFKPDATRIRPYFLLTYLQSDNFVAQLKSMEDGGIQKFVSLTALRNVKLNLPRVSEQDGVCSLLINCDKELDSLQTKLSLLQTQKKYLLNNLVTGKIRTPENLTIN